MTITTNSPKRISRSALEMNQSSTVKVSPEGERADGDLRCERKSGRWRPCVRTVEGHAPMVEAGGPPGPGPPVRRGFADLGSSLVALVRIPNTLRSLTGGVGELTVDGADLAAVLVSLEARHPGSRSG